MNTGRCVKKDLGYLGCSKDILSLTDKLCSGRRSCVIANDRSEMDDLVGTPCYEELASYINITYICMKGTKGIFIIVPL